MSRGGACDIVLKVTERSNGGSRSAACAGEGLGVEGVYVRGRMGEGAVGGSLEWSSGHEEAGFGVCECALSSH